MALADEPAPYRRTAALLAALTVVAALLRLLPIGQLLPQRLEADPHQATRLFARELGLEPLRYDERAGYYPELVPALVSLLPAAFTLPEPSPTESLEAHLDAASRPYLALRLVGALLGALLPLLVFAIGRRWLDARTCLLAAALVATSTLHLTYALQARPHVAHATLVWIALWTLVRLVERPGAARAAAAAAALALGVGSLQSGWFLVPAAVVAAALAQPARARGAAWAWSAPAAACAAGALLLPRARVSAAGLEFSPGGHTLDLGAFDGTGLRRALEELARFDPPLLALGALGAASAAFAIARGAPRRGRAALAVTAAFAAPYAALVALHGHTTERYLILLLPPLALCAAHAVARACRAAAGARFALAGALALALPLASALQTLRLGLRADTRERATAWIEAHADEATPRVCVTPGLYLPRIGQCEALEGRLREHQRPQAAWPAYQERRAADLPAATLDLHFLPVELLHTPREAPEPVERWLSEQPPCWLALEVSAYTRVPGMLAGVDALRDALAARGPPRALFAGEGERWTFELPLAHPSTPWRAWRLLAASAHGPRIEVYRWDGDS